MPPFLAKETQPELISTFLSSKKAVRHRVRLFSKVVSQDPDFALRELPKVISSDMEKDGYLPYALLSLAEARLTDLEKVMHTEAKPGSPLANAVYLQKLRVNFDEAFNALIKRSDGFDILLRKHDYNGMSDPKALLARLGDIPEDWRRQIALNPTDLYYSLTAQQDRLGIPWEDLGFTVNQTNTIRTTFLKKEAYSNPAAAFALLGEYEFTTEEKRDIFQKASQQVRTEQEWEEVRSKLVDPEDQAMFDGIAKKRPTLTEETLRKRKLGSTNSRKEPSARTPQKTWPSTGKNSTQPPQTNGWNHCRKPSERQSVNL
ncbi:MAG: hypothetical protein ACJA16_003724 [Akkermansiaceae bacterium]|jgi:hypothetical protein